MATVICAISQVDVWYKRKDELHTCTCTCTCTMYLCFVDTYIVLSLACC